MNSSKNNHAKRTLSHEFFVNLFDKRCRDFFFQNNTKFQTILLVSIVFKLFRKLISRVLETRFHCSNSSITQLISMKIHVKIEFVRLEFHNKTQKTKIKPRNQIHKDKKTKKDQIERSNQRDLSNETQTTKTKKQQTRDIKTRWWWRQLKSSSRGLWVGFFVLAVDFLFGS